LSFSDTILSFGPLKADLLLHHQKQLKKIKMKKIAFALQVFALMTILPLCVVIEMNHDTVAPTEDKIVLKDAWKVKMVTKSCEERQEYKIKI
jgi:hypothetical protein